METWGDQKGRFLLDLEGEVNRGTTRTLRYSFTPSASDLISNVRLRTEHVSQAVLDDDYYY
jgi:hypothetical protein